MKDSEFAKLVVTVNGLVPLTLLGYDLYGRHLGANPVEFVLDTTGMLALIFLMLTLAVTPLRKISGWNYLSNFRKTLGLFAFFYGCVHFLTYFGFDQSFHVGATFTDVGKRPFILFGMTCLLLMAPLAMTSTKAAIKRLGARRWKQLHWLIYPAGIAGALHFWMRGKVTTPLSLTFAVALVVLLGYRVLARVRAGSQTMLPAARSGAAGS